MSRCKFVLLIILLAVVEITMVMSIAVNVYNRGYEKPTDSVSLEKYNKLSDNYDKLEEQYNNLLNEYVRVINEKLVIEPNKRVGE